ncbi:MAG: hypothetical protein ISP49_16260 [Reyranella sp.]|nr:hypothetical protein [Reyranella sp.]MBL6653151.1 hypothetical protein [Reyranella sp.]
MRWISNITVPRLALAFQAFTVAILGISALVAWSNWNAETSKRQTDATLRYFDPLMDRDYVRYLWEVEEFTLCFERAAGKHVSYERYAEVSRKPESLKLAKGWWELVENADKDHEECGKPMNIEEKLMIVYGRLEALASCARQKLCSFARIQDMIEAIDHLTLLAISNYLLLTRAYDTPISRDWTLDGALIDLVELAEKHVFEGRAAATAYAAVLDRRGKITDGQPAIKPEAIEAIRNKHTRCQRPAVEASSEWRHCVTAER